MRSSRMIGAGVIAVAVLGLAAASVGAHPDIASPMEIHVIEHAISDTVTDTGAAGDTSDSTRVGRDQGDCIRIVPGRSWECRFVTRLAGGSLTVEGPFFDTHNSVLAVTGGTGVYRNARGAMTLKSRAGGTEFDLIFHLIP
jgi:allene oxide cyclase